MFFTFTEPNEPSLLIMIGEAYKVFISKPLLVQFNYGVNEAV